MVKSANKKQKPETVKIRPTAKPKKKLAEDYMPKISPQKVVIDAENAMRRHIESFRTASGTFPEAAAKALGVIYPFQAGWQQKLIKEAGEAVLSQVGLNKMDILAEKAEADEAKKAKISLAPIPKDTGSGLTPQRIAKADRGEEQFDGFYKPKPITDPFKQPLDQKPVATTLRRKYTLDSLRDQKKPDGRPVIDQMQYDAGLRLQKDFYLAGMTASGAIDPTKPKVDSSASPSVAEAKIDAGTRLRLALEAVGIIHSNVLVSIVLHDETLDEYAARKGRYKDRAMARASVLTSLENALDQLDVFYCKSDGRSNRKFDDNMIVLRQSKEHSFEVGVPQEAKKEFDGRTRFDIVVPDRRRPKAATTRS